MQEFPTSAVRGREGGGMRNICGEVCSWELEGRSPSRPLRIGEDGIDAGISNFCGARSGGRRYAEHLRGSVLVGAGGPVALQTSCAREKSEPG